MGELTVDEPGWYQLSGTVPLRGTGEHKVESITWAVPHGAWTRVGNWEVLQSSGANVDVTATGDGEVHLPCAGRVRVYVDRGPMPRYMNSGSAMPTEPGEGALRVTW